MRSQRRLKSCGKAKTVFAVALLILSLLIQAPGSASDLGNKTCKMWEVLEWKIENSAYPVSNPYDLVAKVIFAHESGRTRKTEMFYAGNGTWKFRFCGSRMGQWSFRTVCDGSDDTHSDGSLHNHVGRIIVNAQTNPRIKGFLSHKGSKLFV